MDNGLTLFANNNFYEEQEDGGMSPGIMEPPDPPGVSLDEFNQLKQRHEEVQRFSTRQADQIGVLRSTLEDYGKKYEELQDKIEQMQAYQSPSAYPSPPAYPQDNSYGLNFNLPPSIPPVQQSRNTPPPITPKGEKPLTLSDLEKIREKEAERQRIWQEKIMDINARFDVEYPELLPYKAHLSEIFTASVNASRLSNPNMRPEDLEIHYKHLCDTERNLMIARATGNPQGKAQTPPKMGYGNSANRQQVQPSQPFQHDSNYINKELIRSRDEKRTWRNKRKFQGLGQ